MCNHILVALVDWAAARSIEFLIAFRALVASGREVTFRRTSPIPSIPLETDCTLVAY